MILNKKLLRRFLRSTRAVSEVVGDILLLAISISMAISLSVYIFNLIPSEENKAINYDVKAYLLPAGSSGEYKLIIERVSGDLLPEPSDVSVILRNSSATLGLSYNSSESIVGQKYVYDVLGGTIYPGNKYQIDVIDKSANTMIISGTISAGYVSYEEEVVGTNDVDIIVLGLTVYDPSDGDNRIVPGEPLEARIYLRILRGSSSIKYVNFTMNFPTYLADILFKTFTDIAIINDTTQENATLSIILTPSSQAPYLLLSLNMTNTSNSTHIIDTEITLRIRDTSDLAPGKYSLYSYVTSSTPSDPITSNNYASDDYIVETQVSNISNINNLAIQDVKLDHKIYPAGSQVSGTIEIANIGNTNITSFSLRISLLQRDDTVQTIKYVDYYVDIANYDSDGILEPNEVINIPISDLQGINNTGGSEQGFKLPEDLVGREYVLKFDAYVPYDADYSNNIWEEPIFLDPAILVIDLSYKESIFWDLISDENWWTDAIDSTTLLDDALIIAFIFRDLGYSVDLLDAESGILYKNDGSTIDAFNGKDFYTWISSVNSDDVYSIIRNYQLVVISNGVSDKDGLANINGFIPRAFGADTNTARSNLEKFFGGINEYVESGGYVLLIGGAWDDLFTENYIKQGSSIWTFFENYLGLDLSAAFSPQSTTDVAGGASKSEANKIVGSNYPFFGHYWFFDDRNTPLVNGEHYAEVDTFPVLYGTGYVRVESVSQESWYVIVGNITRIPTPSGFAESRIMIVGTPLGAILNYPERKDFLSRILTWFFPREYDITLNMIWLNIAYSQPIFAFEMPVYLANMGSKGTNVIVSISLVERSTEMPIYQESDIEYLPPYGTTLKYFSLEKVVTGTGIAYEFASNDILFIVTTKPILTEEAKEAYTRDNVYIMPFFNDAEADLEDDDQANYILDGVSGGITEESPYVFKAISSDTRGDYWAATYSYYYGSDIFTLSEPLFSSASNEHHLLFFSNDGDTIMSLDLSEARFGFIQTLEYALSTRAKFSGMSILDGIDGTMAGVVVTDQVGSNVQLNFYYDRAPFVGGVYGVRLGSGDTSNDVYYSNILWSGRAVVFYDLTPFLQTKNKGSLYFYFDFFWIDSSNNNSDRWDLDNIALICRPENPDKYLV